MKFEDIKKDKEILAFLRKGNDNLGILGYTDHSEAHCTLVAERAGYILRKLEYKEKVIELAKMAGFMHDIGNAVNRSHHAEYGAILANDLLKDTDMPLEDRVTLVSAIGNHDESTGGATDAVSAGGRNFGLTLIVIRLRFPQRNVNVPSLLWMLLKDCRIICSLPII